MGGDYSEILSSMEKVPAEEYGWLSWKLRIENLIEAAIEITHNKEDWPTHAVLNTALEMLKSERGFMVDELLEKLEFHNWKEDINSELDFHNGKVDYSSEIEIIRAKLKAAADDVINKFKLDWDIKE